jgi:Family of unknown function (DUF5372)
MVTITRKRHAFEGQALAVVSAIRRRGIYYLLAVLPDGSRSLIPAGWTDWNMDPVRGTPPINSDDNAHDLGRLSDLLRLRNLVDALCNRHTESAPRKESRHAIEPESSRSVRASTKPLSESTDSVGADRRSGARCGRRDPRAPHHTDAPKRTGDGGTR